MNEKPGYMHVMSSAEFDHGDETYFVDFITDIDLGKSWVTAVYYCPDGVTVTAAPDEMRPLAEKAMEKEIDRQRERSCT